MLKEFWTTAPLKIHFTPQMPSRVTCPFIGRVKLNVVPVHTIKAYEGNGGTTLLILIHSAN
jgi:hypothetical protein